MFELIVVMVVVAIAASTAYLSIGRGTQTRELAAAAAEIASRLRSVRSKALASYAEQTAQIDLARREMRTSRDNALLALRSDISIMAEVAESERSSADVVGIRFFPNGSSTGAVLTLKHGSDAFDIKVNWLSGRVSVAARPG